MCSHGRFVMAQREENVKDNDKEDTLIENLRFRSYFFDGGIRFECTRCGACCNGEPGVVYVDDHEITAIAEYTEVPRDVFVERCLYLLKKSYSIRETNDGRCIFFENGCAIYPVRPLQCRTFPFWFQNMRSLDAWEDIALKCPGIGNGKLFSKNAILDCIGLSYPIYKILVKEVILL